MATYHVTLLNLVMSHPHCIVLPDSGIIFIVTLYHIYREINPLRRKVPCIRLCGPDRPAVVILQEGALQPVIGLLTSKCAESQREAALLLGQFAVTTDEYKAKIVQVRYIPSQHLSGPLRSIRQRRIWHLHLTPWSDVELWREPFRFRLPSKLLYVQDQGVRRRATCLPVALSMLEVSGC
jgi:hypothetical protein